jgi:hypothetical protein
LDAAPVADLNLGQFASQLPVKAFGAEAAGVGCDLDEDQFPAPLVAAGAVPGNVDLCSFDLMSSVLHLVQSRSRIEEIEDEVFATVDRMCLRVGELLYEAKVLNPGGFQKWVKTRMPFGYDTARRLVAIHLAYRELPEEKIAQLPRPWQALYALAPHARGKLAAAIASGEIGPDTTVAEARERARDWSSNRRHVDPLEPTYGTADRRAGALMEFQVSDLNPYVRAALARWMDAASTPAGDVPASE